MRACIYKLFAAQGGAGKNLTLEVAALTRKGLDVRIQHALVAVRVIGDRAVPPGFIDAIDDKATALRLFQLVDLICSNLITLPRLYDAVLEGAESLKRSSSQLHAI